MIKRTAISVLPILILVLASTNLTSCYYDNEELLYKYSQTPCDTTVFTYSQKVEPILSANCYSCHGQNSPSSGIPLEGYSTLLPFVSNNKLWGTINQLSGYSPMPKNANKLSNCDLTIIRKWISAGAPNN